MDNLISTDDEYIPPSGTVKRTPPIKKILKKIKRIEKQQKIIISLLEKNLSKSNRPEFFEPLPIVSRRILKNTNI